MKDLIELSNIVTQRKVRSVHIFSASEDGQPITKIQQFYELILKGEFDSDEQAAHYFYGKNKSHSSYQKLRGTLKARLINSLFLIDLKQASYGNRRRAYYESYREWAAAKILFGKQARVAAVSQCRKLAKIARQYEFTELLVDILHTLRLYFGTIEGDPKKYQQYNAEFKKVKKKWHLETEVEELYIDLSIDFVNSRATRHEVQEKAKEYFNTVKPIMAEDESYQIHLCGRLIEVSQFTSVNDYANTIEVCERAIAFFAAKNYEASIPLQIFHYQKLICHLQLQQIEEAFREAEISETFLEDGTFNWFKLQEVRLQLFLFTKDYHAAANLVGKILVHESFINLPGNIGETWKIAEAYLFFIQEVGHLPANTIDGFRSARFINEIEVFSKDKRGMNVHLIILEILLNTVDDNRDRLIDRAEALNKYRTRYLREEGLERSNLFVKMLLQLPKKAFARTAVEAKTEKSFKALQAMPIELVNQAHEIEIVPYEYLWEMTLETL